MDFDLRQLRHARALAEEGSFARASRALHLTQPALSRSIQMLERRVGVTLFDRGRTRVEPTDLGRLFLAHARDVLDSAAALDREVALMRGAASGNIVVGAGTYIAAICVERAIADFIARNPGVSLRVVNDSGTDLLGRLRIGEIDLYVGSLPVGADRDGLAIEPLATRAGGFFVRPGHPWAGRRSIPVDEALRAPLICPTRLPPGLADLLLRAREGEVTGPLPAFACESIEMMRAVARSSDLVLLATVSMVAQDVAAGRLVALSVAGSPPTQEFGVVRLSGRTLPAVVESLVEAIVAADRAGADLDRIPDLRAAPREPAR
jgi:DNA-binding transcriptional LysR family regulator